VSATPRWRSKTLATWLALAGGSLGLHRLYLHGLRDTLAWLHWPPTLAGLVGVLRLARLGQNDALAWWLVPLLGLMLALGALMALVHGLTPDERWAQRHNPGQPPRPTAWGPVLGAVAALLLGGAVLMSTIAVMGQKLAEAQLGR
jgi:hypothetical protein